jgi:DNA replication protein DnaC
MKSADADRLALIEGKLRWLRLPGMVEALAGLYAKACKENLTLLDAIDQLVDEEIRNRKASAVERRIKAARFPEVNTVDGFDFDYDPSRKKLKARYLALHDLTFIDRGVNPLFVGVPSSGKTYLARALAYRACQAIKRVVLVSATRMLNELHGAELHGGLERALRRYVKADLLVIDDFALLAMDPTQAKLAFEVISERHAHRRSTAITTNRPFKDWPKVFPDPLSAEVIAKRLTERCETFIMEKGYRSTEG